MNKLKRLWDWYISGGVPDGVSIGQLRRLHFINIIALLGLVAALPFAISDLPRYPIVGYIELTSAILYVIAGAVLRFWHRPKLATNLLLFSTYLVVMMLVVTGGGDGAGILWVLVFPPLLFFLEERKASFVWIGVVLVTLTLLFATGYFYPKYDKFFYQHICYAVIVTAMIAYYYQKVNLQAEQVNEKIKKELFVGNQKLEQLNLELQRAKAHVEEQVVERTQSLMKEHARLDASVKSLPIGFILTNDQLAVSSINVIAERILKGSDAAGSNADYQAVLYDKMGLEQIIKTVITARKPQYIDEQIFRNRFLRIAIAPIILKGTDAAIGAIILLEDITEKKIVARARDEFFLIASHELRTPLTVVEGNISIIKEHFMDQLKDNEVRDMVNSAYDSTQRLIYIVNQLLQVSALELGEITLDSGRLDLKKVVGQVVQKYSQDAKNKGLTLDNHMPGSETILVRADKERLEQVLGSIIDNAIRNTKKGGVGIDVEVSSNAAKLLVSDTGRGISYDNQALLFHKFHQANASVMTHGIGQSIGLGLYLAKLLIEKMGGRIYLEKSVPGEGSTFVLEIPLQSE